jgi:signal transduction histidine kinase
MEELQGANIIVFILLGTSGMLMLIAAMGIFIMSHQKRMLREKQKQARLELEFQSKMIQMQLDSQETERKRIGADLHDSLGSLLWGAKVNASFIQRSSSLTNDAQDSYNELVQILDESIQTVRRISWELSPEAFHYSGLFESVKKLCTQLNGKGVAVHFTEIGNQLLNDQNALQTFRIVQEVVSNAYKHANAGMISVSMILRDNLLDVRVTDDGKGFDREHARSGVGLWNIEQRVKQIGAQIFIGVPPIGKGTEVLVQIPLYHGSTKA